MKKRLSLWQRITDKPWKRTLTTLGIVTGVALVLFIVAEYSYQLRVQKLVHTLDEVGQVALKSRDAVSLTGAGVGGHCVHIIDAATAIDTGPCPIAAATWLALITKGQEASFMTSVLQKGGVSNPVIMESWEAGGTTASGTSLKVEALPVEGNSEKVPYPAPEGKEWVHINLDAQER